MRVRRLARRMRMSGVARFDLLNYCLRQLPERFRRRGRRIEDENRFAAVAADDDFRIDRNLAEEWNAEELRSFAAAAVAEDFFALAAVPADEVAHVLDD